MIKWFLVFLLLLPMAGLADNTTNVTCICNVTCDTSIATTNMTSELLQCVETSAKRAVEIEQLKIDVEGYTQLKGDYESVRESSTTCTLNLQMCNREKNTCTTELEELEESAGNPLVYGAIGVIGGIIVFKEYKKRQGTPAGVTAQPLGPPSPIPPGPPKPPED